MSKQIRIVKKTTLIFTATDKAILFEMANEKNKEFVNGRELIRFDYDNKIIFSFSDYEAAQIVRMIEKQFQTGGFNFELRFPHLQTKEPKNIQLQFSMYRNNIQCGLSVFTTTTNKRSQIYLDENELELLKEFLRMQYSKLGA